MNPRAWDQRPFLHGALAGYALPFLVVSPALFARRLDGLFTNAQVYWLLPAFALIGFLTFGLMWFLFPHYRGRSLGARFSLGCLAGAWAAGTLLLWVAAPDRPWGNRLVLALFGAPLMTGFWAWIGALLGYAAQQQRVRSPDGSAP